eukprot:TRINITY_DN15977_c0_g1_i1.p1 TRINITY_DN15977_c0_g1~~TRINITY_DN15977_c0_g1_i1.p1  ORF type:complete len:962 (+),score=91.26 TRINITY_DN15977_c0_g1_i1:45-2888(+)
MAELSPPPPELRRLSSRRMSSTLLATAAQNLEPPPFWTEILTNLALRSVVCSEITRIIKARQRERPRAGRVVVDLAQARPGQPPVLPFPRNPLRLIDTAAPGDDIASFVVQVPGLSLVSKKPRPATSAGLLNVFVQNELDPGVMTQERDHTRASFIKLSPISVSQEDDDDSPTLLRMASSKHLSPRFLPRKPQASGSGRSLASAASAASFARQPSVATGTGERFLGQWAATPRLMRWQDLLTAVATLAENGKLKRTVASQFPPPPLGRERQGEVIYESLFVLGTLYSPLFRQSRVHTLYSATQVRGAVRRWWELLPRESRGDDVCITRETYTGAVQKVVQLLMPSYSDTANLQIAEGDLPGINSIDFEHFYMAWMEWPLMFIRSGFPDEDVLVTFFDTLRAEAFREEPLQHNKLSPVARLVYAAKVVSRVSAARSEASGRRVSKPPEGPAVPGSPMTNEINFLFPRRSSRGKSPTGDSDWGEVESEGNDDEEKSPLGPPPSLPPEPPEPEEQVQTEVETAPTDIGVSAPPVLEPLAELVETVTHWHETHRVETPKMSPTDADEDDWRQEVKRMTRERLNRLCETSRNTHRSNSSNQSQSTPYSSFQPYSAAQFIRVLHQPRSEAQKPSAAIAATALRAPLRQTLLSKCATPVPPSEPHPVRKLCAGTGWKLLASLATLSEPLAAAQSVEDLLSALPVQPMAESLTAAMLAVVAQAAAVAAALDSMNRSSQENPPKETVLCHDEHRQPSKQQSQRHVHVCDSHPGPPGQVAGRSRRFEYRIAAPSLSISSTSAIATSCSCNGPAAAYATPLPPHLRKSHETPKRSNGTTPAESHLRVKQQPTISNRGKKNGPEFLPQSPRPQNSQGLRTSRLGQNGLSTMDLLLGNHVGAARPVTWYEENGALRPTRQARPGCGVAVREPCTLDHRKPAPLPPAVAEIAGRTSPLRGE